MRELQPQILYFWKNFRFSNRLKFRGNCFRRPPPTATPLYTTDARARSLSGQMYVNAAHSQEDWWHSSLTASVGATRPAKVDRFLDDTRRATERVKNRQHVTGSDVTIADNLTRFVVGDDCFVLHEPTTTSPAKINKSMKLIDWSRLSKLICSWRHREYDYKINKRRIRPPHIVRWTCCWCCECVWYLD